MTKLREQAERSIQPRPNPARPEILGKHEISIRLYSLIKEAKERVTLISPYVSIEKMGDLTRYVRGALSRNVKVTLVVRYPDMDKDRIKGPNADALRELMDAGLKLLAVKNLHAKIYLSERGALLTSLNLLHSSLNSSIEIGVWTDADAPEYQKIRAFIHDELQPPGIALPYPFTGPKAQEEEDEDPPDYDEDDEDDDISFDAEEDEGFCIRCGDEIPFNPERPYCASDYAKWARYKDENYQDSTCHGCGDEYAATMRRPLCRDCYRNRQDEDAPY